MKLSKRGMVWNELGGWVIALIVLSILLFFILFVTNGGINNLIEKLKTFFTFGG